MLDEFITETREAAQLESDKRGCLFTVVSVDPSVALEGNRDLLLGAPAKILSNAFKFTNKHTEVLLTAYSQGVRILIDVKDHCGGLQSGDAEKMFSPFTQRGSDKTGLGLGLSIARQNVTADEGHLTVENFSG